MKLSNFTIGKRLVMAFTTILAIMLIMTGFSLTRLNIIQTNAQQVFERNLPGIVNAEELAIILRQNYALTLELFNAKDQDQRTPHYAMIDANKKKVVERIELLKQLADTPDEQSAIQNFQSARELFVAAFSKTADLIELDQRDDAIKVMNTETTPALKRAMEAADQIINLQKQDSQANQHSIINAISTSRNLTLTAGSFAILIGVLLAWLITRSITNPLQQAVAVAIKVADGDLSGKISVQSQDETGRLLSALADMNNSLLSTIASVRQSAEMINTASNEIAQGNADLSARTESQASSLEETASSMEELTSTVRQNADNARQANQLAISATSIANKGGQVVDQVVVTMGSIKTSSSKIVDIISVIDGIAFQTNILALNAAVEAARAGEQGRGFAVVASEVRTLAQRSASAAKEIKTLIDDSVAQVNQGNLLVEQAGQTMQEILSGIRQVADIMAEITAASQEQSAGIEQVNQAITTMDEVTQQNAALVEQAAAAAESLQEQAANLQQTIGIFRLEPQSVASPQTARQSLTKTPQLSAQTNTGAAQNRAASKQIKPAVKSNLANTSKTTLPKSSEEANWEEF